MRRKYTELSMRCTARKIASGFSLATACTCLRLRRSSERIAGEIRVFVLFPYFQQQIIHRIAKIEQLHIRLQSQPQICAHGSR